MSTPPAKISSAVFGVMPEPPAERPRPTRQAVIAPGVWPGSKKNRVLAWVTSARYPISSMSSPSISPDKQAQLEARLAGLGVHESDIEETFVRSGGHGG